MEGCLERADLIKTTNLVTNSRFKCNEGDQPCGENEESDYLKQVSGTCFKK